MLRPQLEAIYVCIQILFVKRHAAAQPHHWYFFMPAKLPHSPRTCTQVRGCGLHVKQASFNLCLNFLFHGKTPNGLIWGYTGFSTRCAAVGAAGAVPGHWLAHVVG